MSRDIEDILHEAKTTQREMKRSQEKLLKSHSVDERNALLAPEEKLPDYSVGNSMDDGRQSRDRCNWCPDNKKDPRYHPNNQAEHHTPQPYFGSTFTLDRPLSEVLKELGYEDSKMLRALRIEEDFREMVQKELDKKDQIIENLHGLIRRLEAANSELGQENHRLGGKGVGWNKNVR